MADVDRFETPLYSVGEAGHYLGLSKTTLARWAQGYEHGAAIVTTVPGQPRGSAVIPFVGLATRLRPRLSTRTVRRRSTTSRSSRATPLKHEVPGSLSLSVTTSTCSPRSWTTTCTEWSLS